MNYETQNQAGAGHALGGGVATKSIRDYDNGPQTAVNVGAIEVFQQRLKVLQHRAGMTADGLENLEARLLGEGVADGAPSRPQPSGQLGAVHAQLDEMEAAISRAQAAAERLASRL